MLAQNSSSDKGTLIAQYTEYSTYATLISSQNLAKQENQSTIPAFWCNERTRVLSLLSCAMSEFKPTDRKYKLNNKNIKGRGMFLDGRIKKVAWKSDFVRW